MGSVSTVLVMGGCLYLVAAVGVLVTALAGAHDVDGGNKTGRAFSLFSIVQFPNAGCTGSSSSTTFGTCYTATECSAAGGSADGNCAAGFGVCCLITNSTCGAMISTNTTYIRNPGYPSSYTPSSTGNCNFAINKSAADICQLSIDFQTMSGFDETAGVCSDSLATAGQTGKQPPTVCGTMTGYHMYTEFGTTSTDTITLTLTYGSTTTAKTWNLLLRQISCDATWKAPTDCAQYFTGSTGTIQSYNFAGASCYKACTTLTVSGLSQATVAYSTKSLLGRHQTPLTSSQTVPPMLSLLLVAALSPLSTSPTSVLTESPLLESPPALSPSSL